MMSLYDEFTRLHIVRMGLFLVPVGMILSENDCQTPGEGAGCPL